MPVSVRLTALALLCSAMLGLAACSPASGFDNQEERWGANQTTQPVKYAAPQPSDHGAQAEGHAAPVSADETKPKE